MRASERWGDQGSLGYIASALRASVLRCVTSCFDTEYLPPCPFTAAGFDTVRLQLYASERQKHLQGSQAPRFQGSCL